MRLGIGVERWDFTKGIVERFLALEKLFDEHAQWRGRMTLLQVAAHLDHEVFEAALVEREDDVGDGHERWVGMAPRFDTVTRSFPAGVSGISSRYSNCIVSESSNIRRSCLRMFASTVASSRDRLW